MGSGRDGGSEVSSRTSSRTALALHVCGKCGLKSVSTKSNLNDIAASRRRYHAEGITPKVSRRRHHAEGITPKALR